MNELYKKKDHRNYFKHEKFKYNFNKYESGKTFLTLEKRILNN